MGTRIPPSPPREVTPEDYICHKIQELVDETLPQYVDPPPPGTTDFFRHVVMVSKLISFAETMAHITTPDGETRFNCLSVAERYRQHLIRLEKAHFRPGPSPEPLKRIQAA